MTQAKRVLATTVAVILAGGPAPVAGFRAVQAATVGLALVSFSVAPLLLLAMEARSEERRVGKEC